MPETENDPSASTASFRAFAQRSEEDNVPARRGAFSSRAMIILAVAVGIAIVFAVIMSTV